MPAKAPRLSTIFYWCNDVPAMRHFYTELLGLQETFYAEAKDWYTCKLGETDLVFGTASEKLPMQTHFAKEPGYAGGTVEAAAWVIEYTPEEFDAVVARLKAAGVPAYQDTPLEPQEGARQFFVLDPMGLTIEVYQPTEES